MDLFYLDTVSCDKAHSHNNHSDPEMSDENDMEFEKVDLTGLKSKRSSMKNNSRVIENKNLSYLKKVRMNKNSMLFVNDMTHPRHTKDPPKDADFSVFRQ